MDFRALTTPNLGVVGGTKISVTRVVSSRRAAIVQTKSSAASL
jgi:hypothetical protein